MSLSPYTLLLLKSPLKQKYVQNVHYQMCIRDRYNGNQWLIDSAVYYSEAKDYIASLICDGSIVCNGNTNSSRSSYYYYDNIDRAKTWGLEISAEYNLSLIHIS